MAVPLILFCILAFIAFLIWNRTRDNLERRRLQLDAQARMLERIGPGEALTEFLRTDEGRQFFDRLTVAQSEPTRGKDTSARVFALTTLGLIALFGGFFLVMAALVPNLLAADPRMPIDLLVAMALPAFLLTGGGVGALVAAWIMRRLSKRWGTWTARGAGPTSD